MRMLLALIPAFILTGCVSQYKVVVDFSPELQPHFVEFPTIEVDIAALTDAEADEVKQMGVEKYFAPGSGIRQRLNVQTCFFSKEERYTYVLPSRAPVWQTWKQKKPSTLMVIASLPHDPSMSPQADPRLLTVAIAKSFIVARSVYIWVEPKRIIRVTKAAYKKGEKDSPKTEQWIEIRESR